MTRIRGLLHCGICWMARDLSRARAILIGNATFQHRQIDDLPAAAGCVAAMTGLLTGDLCSWPAGRVVRLEDMAKPDDLARRVIAAVRDAQDVLLVYYTGHGYRTRNGQLALALGETDPDPETLPHTAMLYENLADILRGCRAATKLVILDCCHAELGGKANYVFQGGDLAEAYPVDGLYFIGASKWDQNAKSPRDGQLTYFTQALVNVVRAGIPGLPDELRLDQIFLEVRARLVKARLPEPVDSGIRGARQYPFARNAARPASTAQALDTHVPARTVSSGRRKMRAAWAAGATALAAAAVIGAYVASGPHGSASQSHGSESGSRGPASASHGPTPSSRESPAIVARVYSDASYGFNAPNRIAADSDHIWVTNPPGNSVTELNASDGSLVRILSGAGYGFGGPVGIASDGTHVWVTSTNGNSVTELNVSDGSPVRILSGAGYGFGGPVGIASDGTHVWVTNTNSNSVTELNASDGSLVRILTGASYSFSRPYAVAIDRTHVLIANANGSSVTELNASDGSPVRTLTGAAYSNPTAIADDGTHVWVANATGNSVTELNASDGSLVRTLNSATYGFDGPRAVALDGTHVWVANASGNSVTELNASDGSWVTTLTGVNYGFSGPWGMAADGTHIWVTNSGGNTVTELTTR